MSRQSQHPSRRSRSKRWGAIYYQRVVGRKRIRGVAAFRDLYEARKGIGRFPVPMLDAPRFADFAQLYLEEDVGHWAVTTRQNRKRLLGETAPLLSFFGTQRLNEITAGLIRECWNQEVVAKSRAMGTRGHLRVHPGRGPGLPARRWRCSRRAPSPPSARACAAAAALGAGGPSRSGARRSPRIVRAAAQEGPEALALLCLDASLRLGEALGLAGVTTRRTRAGR